jgi:hypothetical protein
MVQSWEFFTTSRIMRIEHPRILVPHFIDRQGGIAVFREMVPATGSITPGSPWPANPSPLRVERRVAAVCVPSTESDPLWPSSSEERGVVMRELVK